jgi:hypothetical protein
MGMGFHPVEGVERSPADQRNATARRRSLLFPIDGGGVNERVPFAPFRMRADNPGIRPEIAGKLGIHGGLDVLRQTADGASS